ncbi:MAG TPA: hypothetical protein VIO11_02600 [Candidatus Methanoperedens sp.]
MLEIGGDTLKELIELMAAFIMPFGIYLIYRTRIQGQGKGISVRVIQLAAVVLVIPSILILALEGVLKTEIVATLLGTIVGYTLSGVEDKDKNS